MQTILVQTLSPSQLSDIESIYTHKPVVSIEQYPGFAQASEPHIPVWYLLIYRGDTLIGYACIKIKKRIFATLLFGPVVGDFADYQDICRSVVSHCLKKGVLVIKIIPPYLSEEEKNVVSSFTNIKFEQSDRAFNWASLKLALDKPMDELLKNFSENHRRNIKKAQKLNLTVSEITSTQDIDTFADQYVKMYTSRGLDTSLSKATLSFQNLFTFFREHKNGVFLAVRSEAGDIIGGLCISYQGNAAFYFKGYSHPEHRSLPINHLAFYEAIKLAKDKGLDYFDFGGYGTNLKENDSMHAINRFKEGFGGDLNVYTQTLTIYTTPVSKLLYSLYRRLRKTEE